MVVENRLDQLGIITRVVLEVRVLDDDDVVSGPRESIAQGRPFPLVARAPDQRDVGDIGKRLHDVPGAVGRAVVDQDDLCLERDGLHAREERRNRGRLVDAEKWTVTEAAAKLGCTRQTFSRLLNGRTGISPAMALALERIGWSNAAFWVRRQAQYELAQERLRQKRTAA